MSVFPEATPEQIKKGRYWAARSYAGFLSIPAALRKDNPFVAWHGKQGLVFRVWFLLLGAGAIGILVLTILLAARTQGRLAICATSWVVVSSLLIILTTIFGVIAAIKAGRGRYYRIPILGAIAERIRK